MSNPPFTGRVALVTGASRGIGQAIALRLAHDGADVAVGFFRNRRGAERTVDWIANLGRKAVALKVHLGDPAKVRALVADATAALGEPTIVVSNAASGVLRPLAEIDEQAWAWTMDVNARALLLLANEAAPAMAEAGGGSIVALSSLGASRVLPNYGAVGASKAVLESLVRYLAVELAPRYVRVNAVSAGVVETDALSHFPNREELLDAARARTPAGRMVAPADVAGVVSFLCSQDAEMIRGQVLTVDGGYSLLA